MNGPTVISQATMKSRGSIHVREKEKACFESTFVMVSAPSTSTSTSTGDRWC